MESRTERTDLKTVVSSRNVSISKGPVVEIDTSAFTEMLIEESDSREEIKIKEQVLQILTKP